MPFDKFSLREVETTLAIRVATGDLFADTAARSVRPEFATDLADTARLAVQIGTEQAKSEFVIAPVLLELRRLLSQQCGLFSGVELEGDPFRGLNGVSRIFCSPGTPHER